MGLYDRLIGEEGQEPQIPIDLFVALMREWDSRRLDRAAVLDAVAIHLLRSGEAPLGSEEKGQIDALRRLMFALDAQGVIDHLTSLVACGKRGIWPYDTAQMIEAQLNAYAEPILPQLKEELINSIDKAAEERIASGPALEWPPSSGKFLSLSQNAQIKWTGMFAVRNEPEVSYPLTISTWNDEDTHVVADADEVRNIYLSMVAFVRQTLSDATDAKQAVLDAADAESAWAAAADYVGNL